MRLRGLYAIADPAVIGAADFSAAVEAALAGGAVAVQYRDKLARADERAQRARDVVQACHRAGALAIINDTPSLAASVGADGVHLGADDPEPEAVREQLGTGAIVGVSCYDQLARAQAAQAAGADYIAFGRMFPSATKPGGPHPDAELLGRARAQTGLAVCAIGGITVERAPALVRAGADLLAVCGDLFAREDIAAQARAYASIFGPMDPPHGTGSTAS